MQSNACVYVCVCLCVWGWGVGRCLCLCCLSVFVCVIVSVLLVYLHVYAPPCRLSPSPCSDHSECLANQWGNAWQLLQPAQQPVARCLAALVLPAYTEHLKLRQAGSSVLHAKHGTKMWAQL